MGKRLKVYLSGPEHLLPNGKEVLEEMYALCEQYGFDPIHLPDALFDPGSSFEEGVRIAEERRNQIGGCDVIFANTMDFRDTTEPYGETSFELGYAWRLGKKLYCYMPDARGCDQRYPGEKHQNESGRWVDENGIGFEPGPLNLMLHSPSVIVEGTLEDALKRAVEDLASEEE